MKRLVSWSCLACSQSNAADVATCGNCGCPARATVRQMEVARGALSGRGHTAFGERLSEPFPWASLWNLFPGWLLLAVAWVVLAEFTVVSALLTYLTVGLGVLWAGRLFAKRRTTRAAAQAAGLALLFSPGILVGHGFAIVPASLGMFFHF